MKTQKRRGLLATIGAVAAGAALALSGTVAASAAPPQPAPIKSDVTITKCEQPATMGDPATGVKQTGVCATGTGIGQVVFEYYLVPETGEGGAKDIGTNTGQAYAAGLAVDTAQSVDGFPTDATGTFNGTDAGGVTTKKLPRGLYLVKEKSAPAGVTPALPFLLAVPMTNPSTLNTWLDHIYVYPKNAKITAEKSVVNAEDYVVGDDVAWTISTQVPRNPNPKYGETGEPQFVAPDAFQIWDTYKTDELEAKPAVSTTNPVVKVAGTSLTISDAAEGFDPTNDYYVVTSADGAAPTTTHKIILTSAGLAKMATAVNAEDADGTAAVTVTFVTTVLKSGVLVNNAKVFPDSGSLPTESDTMGKPLTASATVKYGNTVLTKKSTDTDLTGAALAGAEFKVYLTEAAAKAGGTDNVVPTFPSGTSTTGYSNGVWTTQSGGTVTIDGLRYSNFADGVDQTKYSGESCADTTNGGANCTLNAKYQTYWLVETKALDGHQLLAEPIPFEITMSDSSTGFDVTNTKTTGGFTLPLTGGTGTLLLTVGGIALLATVLVVARRRRSAEAAE